jgi:hypothetical protein
MILTLKCYLEIELIYSFLRVPTASVKLWNVITSLVLDFFNRNKTRVALSHDNYFSCAWNRFLQEYRVDEAKLRPESVERRVSVIMLHSAISRYSCFNHVGPEDDERLAVNNVLHMHQRSTYTKRRLYGVKMSVTENIILVILHRPMLWWAKSPKRVTREIGKMKSYWNFLDSDWGHPSRDGERRSGLLTNTILL